MSNNHIETAQQIVTQLSQGDFVGAWQHAESSIRERFSAEQLRAGWQGVEAQAGPFKGQVRTHSTASPQGEIVVVTCAFGTTNIDINVVFNAVDQVIGLTITPTGTIDQQLAAHESVPAYVHKDLFHEQEVEVGRGEWKLPGTLSLPVGNGPFLSVVLIHGSGPSDRDETLGPNKPFRDLAWGLASQGIAVLRYEKRTRVYGPKMQEHLDTLTIQEEVIDDALGAVALLRGVPQLDTRHIFVLAILILQGESDYQVTMKDFRQWQHALADRTDVQFQSYPALSHIFAPVEGGSMATPATYAIPAHVAEEVVTDIASWIKQHAT